MLAVLGDGTVRAWGYNVGGELGNGTTTNSSTPVTVSGLTTVTQVAAGGLPGEAGHSLALRSDGTVWAWGYNDAGQLGNSSTTNSVIPVQVSGLSSITAIAAGGENGYALRSDGTVWAWGDNTYGQLGNTSAGSRATTPMQVNITAVTAIAGGGTHALALRNDGTAWAWGDNDDGELGNGGSCGNTCSTPVKVSNLSGVAAIGGGYKHSLAATSTGSAWAFGENGSGQLGNGTTTNATTPVQVNSLTATKPVPSITSYAYDGNGLRATKSTTSVTQHFAWDYSAPLPLLLTDGASSWIYGPGGLPLEQVSGPTTLYYYEDQLGSTRVLADGAGTVQTTYAYDAYGNITATTGIVSTPLLFAGQYRDLETGFYYLRARYYDPTTGEFLSRDPVNAVTRQPYSYGVGDPLNVVDPRGLGQSVSDLMSCMTCQELSNAINRWTDIVEQKASNIVNNPLGLPLTGPSMSVGSHMAPWLGYQDHLDKLITAWVLKGCGGLEDLPVRVLVWATEPAPQPKPQQQPAPSSTSPVNSTPAIAGALAILGTVLWWAAKPACLFTGPAAVGCALAA